MTPPAWSNRESRNGRRQRRRSPARHARAAAATRLGRSSPVPRTRAPTLPCRPQRRRRHPLVSAGFAAAGLAACSAAGLRRAASPPASSPAALRRFVVVGLAAGRLAALFDSPGFAASGFAATRAGGRAAAAACFATRSSGLRLGEVLPSCSAPPQRAPVFFFFDAAIPRSLVEAHPTRAALVNRCQQKRLEFKDFAAYHLARLPRLPAALLRSSALMNICSPVAAPADEKADLLAVGCAEDTLEDNPLLDAFDTALGGSAATRHPGRAFQGQGRPDPRLPTHGRLPAARLALLGLGKRASIALPALRTFAGRAARLAQSVGARRAGPARRRSASSARGPSSTAWSSAWSRACCSAATASTSTSRRTSAPRCRLRVALLLGAPPRRALEAALARGERVAAAVARARDLVNEPAGYMTPTRLAEVAHAIAGEHGLELHRPRPGGVPPAGHGPVPRRRPGQRRGAALHPPGLEAGRPAQAHRAHRQGRDLRLRRPLAQAQRRACWT